jgi:uracil-DNA glycosylase
MPDLELTLLIGRAAQLAYLPEAGSMSDVVGRAEACEGIAVPLPHPSWHNNAWLARNAWFEERMLPRLQRRISAIVGRPQNE